MQQHKNVALNESSGPSLNDNTQRIYYEKRDRGKEHSAKLARQMRNEATTTTTVRHSNDEAIWIRQCRQKNILEPLKCDLCVIGEATILFLFLFLFELFLAAQSVSHCVRVCV